MEEAGRDEKRPFRPLTSTSTCSLAVVAIDLPILVRTCSLSSLQALRLQALKKPSSTCLVKLRGQGLDGPSAQVTPPPRAVWGSATRPVRRLREMAHGMK